MKTCRLLLNNSAYRETQQPRNPETCQKLAIETN